VQLYVEMRAGQNQLFDGMALSHVQWTEFDATPTNPYRAEGKFGRKLKIGHGAIGNAIQT
jgi:hypothetical protein